MVLRELEEGEKCWQNEMEREKYDSSFASQKQVERFIANSLIIEQTQLGKSFYTQSTIRQKKR